MSNATPTARRTGPALRALRKAAGLSIEEAADRAGVGMSYLSRAERDLVTPTTEWKLNLALALGHHLAGQQAS